MNFEEEPNLFRHFGGWKRDVLLQELSEFLLDFVDLSILAVGLQARNLVPFWTCGAQFQIDFPHRLQVFEV